MAAESKRAVVAATAGNVAIAVIKFVAAAMTGSSAMMSEGIHSIVDTGNGALLLHGLRRGARPADAQHPFGHGMEVYFWSLIVAMSIFGIGGGMSMYEGINHLRHPAALQNPLVNYIVLALAVVFESLSFSVAWKTFRRSRRGRPTLAAIHHGKDPSLFTILFEDTAALLGLFVAFVGVLVSHLFHAPLADGAASVVIGLILVVAALWLAHESRSLLVGEAADPELVTNVPCCRTKHIPSDAITASHRRTLCDQKEKAIHPFQGTSRRRHSSRSESIRRRTGLCSRRKACSTASRPRSWRPARIRPTWCRAA